MFWVEKLYFKGSGDKILMGDLNVLDMIHFDVILGINISEVCVSKL